MRVLRHRAVLAAAALLAVLAVAPAAKAIIGGKPDGKKHPYVGFVTAMGRPLCSGFLVSPTVFVTAAHCAYPAPGVVLGRVNVTVDEAALAPGAHSVPGTLVPHPDFCGVLCDPTTGVDVRDVAVVLLDRPIELKRYARLPRHREGDELERLEGDADRHLRVTVVGYGATGFGPAGPVSSFERMQGKAKLLDVAESIGDEFVRMDTERSAFCYGDSGGPSLVGHTAIGVNSWFDARFCDGSAYSYRLDTPAAQAFLGRYVDLHPGRGHENGRDGEE